MLSSATAPLVSLQVSLADNARTQIEEWFEDLQAKARGLCIQWDSTGAITLVARDRVWNAVTGNITNLFGRRVDAGRCSSIPSTA
jgi:hypothetical protein